MLRKNNDGFDPIRDSSNEYVIRMLGDQNPLVKAAQQSQQQNANDKPAETKQNPVAWIIAFIIIILLIVLLVFAFKRITLSAAKSPKGKVV
jgi:ATP-dependent Zn protease